MTLQLPDGFDAGAPTVEDAVAIHELVMACDLPVIGRVDSTIDDIRDQLSDPALDLEHDSWLVRHGADLVAWAWVRRRGDSENVNIDPYVHPDFTALVSALWDLAEARAIATVADVGHGTAVAHIGAYREDTVRRAAAKQRGYAVATTFHRLRIDHGSHAATEAAHHHGVSLVIAGADDALRRMAHSIHEEAFSEHFGFTPRAYEKWLQDKESQSTFDWSQLLVAFVDNEPAAMLAGSNQFVSDENCGYVQNLATLSTCRGRGLASLLLREHFRRDAQHGRVGTYLHVDANNTTGASRLYESVGMRLSLVMDVWRKRVGG